MDKDAFIARLQKTNETQAEQLKQQSVMLEKLSQQVETLLRQLYGKKSEKSKRANKNTSPPSSDKNAKPSDPNTSSGNQPKRSRLPDNLDTVDVVHDLPEKEKRCGYCASQLHQSGKRITEQLDFIPAKLIKHRHICLKYACRCEHNGVKVATMPNQPIEKGMPGPGLLAEILVSKYQDSMPLYRQMLRFKRLGYSLSDSTLCDWIASCAFLLKPLVDVMFNDLLQANKLHTDDTPIPVLAKGKTKQGRLWVYLADNTAKKSMCLYDYTSTRRAEGPMRYLKDFHGYLQADAYSGYDALYQSQRVIEVGCMAHARRKFYDVALAAKGPSHAQDIVDIMRELYNIEKHIKHKTSFERYYYRKKWAKPILKRLRRLISYWLKRALPNSPFFKALQYADNHWIALTRYLAHGDLAIDNNKAERAIKPLVIGRKNWLFAGSHEGGKRAAIIYSIIETCKMNQVDPFKYLVDVLARLPNTLQKNIRDLLPYHWHKTDENIPLAT